MKRVILCLLLVFCCSLLSCADQWKGPQLALTVSNWNGLLEDFEPEIQEFLFDANPRLTIQALYSRLPTFSVISVSDTEIHIRSDIPLSQSGESGGINLSSEQCDFIIPYGESITLNTLTMDTGMIYTFSYLKNDFVSAE